MPYTGQASLPADGEITLRANLQRPGGHVAGYQHWYVIAAAVVIAGGVAGGAIYDERRRTGDVGPGQRRHAAVAIRGHRSQIMTSASSPSSW